MSRWLIVGAGFSGAVIARFLADQGHECIVTDRRGHIAGNAYDPIHESGLRIHQYGPHAFHTNSTKVFDFLSRFTGWIPYEHRVLGLVDGQKVPIPFNFTSLKGLLPDRAESLKSELLAHYPQGSSIPVMKLIESSAPNLKELGQYVLEKVFMEYTRKQWAMEPLELGPSIMARVPIRLSEDDRYFEDKFQFMPKHGYVGLFNSMLDHPLITLELNHSVSPKEVRKSRQVIYTGALDELMEYEFGPLAYRSLKFELEIKKTDYFLKTAQLNFPDSRPSTRVTEFKHMTGQLSSNTLLAYEIPLPHLHGINEPYYPIPTEHWKGLHRRYLESVLSAYPNVRPLGRLADYRYYNMDQAVARALQVGSEILS